MIVDECFRYGFVWRQCQITLDHHYLYSRRPASEAFCASGTAFAGESGRQAENQPAISVRKTSCSVLSSSSVKSARWYNGQDDATSCQLNPLTLPVFNQLLCPLTLVPAENDGTEIMITAYDLRLKVLRQGIPKPIDHRLETLRPRRFRSIPTKGDRGERDIHRKREIPRFLLLHPFAEHGGTERVVGFDIVHDSIVVVDDFDFVFKDKGPPCVEALGWGHAIAAFVFGDGFSEGLGLAGDEVVEFGTCFVDEVVCGMWSLEVDKTCSD